MRRLTIPLPITIRTGAIGADGKPLTKEETFAEFLHDNIFTRFGNKLRDVRRALKIYDKLVDAQPGDAVEIDGSDWDKMMEQLQTGDWNPFLALQVQTFFEAIEAATEK